MAATFGGQGDVVRRLLDLGADHTPVGTGMFVDDKTALELAEAENFNDSQEQKKGKEAAAAALREWATSHPDAEYDARIAAYDKSRHEKALLDAATRGKVAEIRVLLAAGTDPNSADDEGHTALYKAVGQGKEDPEDVRGRTPIDSSDERWLVRYGGVFEKRVGKADFPVNGGVPQVD